MEPIRFDDGDRQVLLDRFLRYVKVDTRSEEDADTFPSSARQLDLSRLLVEELQALGLGDAHLDPHGYVYATVPANLPEGHPAVPTVGLLAHVDTYPGVSGRDVKPQLIEGYAGGEVPLPGTPDRPLRPADHPNLERCLGHTLITTDGTTLLGADDKAGVAEIVTAVDWLLRHPEVPHGTIRLCFTPDEEVGNGTEHLDVAAFGADLAYTLDGSDLGEIEDETFNADGAVVQVTGHDVHPGSAKGHMVNAARVAAWLVSSLPEAHLPETTEGRESFLHPMVVEGDVSQARVKLIVRAFSLEELEARKADLVAAAEAAETRFPGAKVSVAFTESYRNMGYKLAEDPRVVAAAVEAIRRQGVTPKRAPIRGGTDGARLSYMGLLCPNLFAGGQSFHSVHEWVSLEWMVAASETAVQLLNVWTDPASVPDRLD